MRRNLKKLLLLLLMIAGFGVQAHATPYFLSPTGSDSNNGLSSGAPWLTPNHALNCGDTITAASGTYSSSNFQTFGTVTCSAGNNVAWLQCATFDTCKISTTTQDAMQIQKSYWGIEGWETTTSSNIFAACYRVTSTSGVTHHIIFANDIANGCMGGGFEAYATSTANSVDYIVYIGDIAYNAAQGTGACYSGFNVYEPKASDTVAGTHIFAAGNFAWANKDGSPCSGSSTTDGEGINFDTWDFSQSGGTPYTQQGYITNNISFLNGGYGIEMENNKAGGSSFAHLTIANNTEYGNRRDTNQTFCSGNGDLYLFGAFGVTATNNLIYTGQATDCSGDALYAMAVASSNSSTTVSGNYASGVSGNNTFTDGAGGFTFGTNVLGTNPNFANPVNPGAPSCGSFANVQACMATVIANFVPSASGASAYGYQSPGPSVVNALFPHWLCSGTSLISGIPSGLITPGCGAGTTVNPGMSQSAVQAAINALSSGSTATFAAGTYTVTSTLNIPCGVSVSGPVVPLAVYTTGDGYLHQGYTPTATIQGNLGRSNWLMTLASCSTAQSIRYLAFNGETPSALGGGSIHVPAGNSNLTIQYNYAYGNQTAGTSCCGAPQDGLIYLDGNNPANNDQNDTISWNRFGANGNCSNIMSNVSGVAYQGGSAGGTGGNCVGVGIHTGATNLNITNNVFYYQEQGIKHFTGTSNTASFCNLCTIADNDFSNIHRIAFETQINPGQGAGTGHGSAETIQYNSYHDPFVPFYGTFAISAANGESNATNSTYNTLIANISPLCCGNPASEYIAMADELWGSGSTSSNNLMQGYFANGIAYNSIANFTMQNNSFCGPGTPSKGGMVYINNSCGGNGPCNNTNVISGNTPGTANTVNAFSNVACTVTASTASTIYPPPGSYTFPQTVTLSNTGINTSTWYTTDGSTPVPGTGTAKLYSVPFTMTAAGTVNAVGMWGAPNQPTSYPASYGYAPSSVASAAYTGSGGTPTASTPVMTPSSQSFTGTLSVSVSDSTPSSTIYCTTNGTTPTTASPVYTGAFSFTASTTLQCIANAPGFLQSGVGSGSYTLNTPTLTGGSLTNTGNINTLVVGAPAIQFTAVGNYSDSVNRNLPDSFSNTAVWSSSNGSILNVGSTGLVSCAAVGSANVQVTSSPTSIVFNIWTMTCTSGTTPTVATPVLTPVSQTFTGSLAVVISDSTGGSTIHYTTDGTTPTTSSPVYTGTFSVTATTTVKAIATATGYNQSAVGSATYMLQAATISSAYLTIPGNLNYTTIGAHVQFTATIVYSDGAQLTSTVVGVANSRGDSISSWTTSASGVGTISTSGSMLGVALGVTHIQAVINGSVNSNPWFEYVSASANTVTKGTTSKGVTIQ